MEAKYDSTNNEQRAAYRMIEKTNNSFFLTGRAGTGKTSFLKAVQQNIGKNFIVLAPTGQAAINAGGQTIHSFFGFGLGVLGPNDYGRLSQDKFNVIAHLDTIIIDEMSMVRCDIVDAMDRTLRACLRSSAPFGGVQMVFVGDMFQLEPIVTPQDREMLREIYGQDGYAFYDAAVLRRASLPKIEFRKIYRQSDAAFIELLEHVRIGRVTSSDMALINSRFNRSGDGGHRVTLTSTNADAKRINDDRLARIGSEPATYQAVYAGKFARDIVEDSLVLKAGAQVMFTRNDSAHRWVNGTLGEVMELGDDNVTVKLDGGETYKVEYEDWDSIEYEYDRAKKTCAKTIVGRVSQLPLRLAWAITIHKSQSLTFDRVAVDFGQRGAFANGQAYVALSRARSLEGLELVRPMSPASIRVSRGILGFARDFNDAGTIDRELAVGEAVSGFEKSGDYDGAAKTLFAMAGEAAAAGQADRACYCLSRAMDFAVDDSCLFGADWTLLGGTGDEISVANACGLYYGGNAPAAEAVLNTVDPSWLDGNLLGLYILARCLEDGRRWKETENVYYRMLAVYASYRDSGLDSIAFRKLKYRLAVLNERQYGDPGLEIIRGLIAENPNYDSYHLAFRWMFLQHRDELLDGSLSISDDGSESLLGMLIDPSGSEDRFLERLQTARREKSEEWDNYLTFISKLKTTN